MFEAGPGAMARTDKPIDLLAGLAPATRAAIEAETERISLSAGQTLFRAGGPGDAFYFVLSGSLGVYVAGAEGKQRLLAIIEAGESVGEMAVISGQARSATVRAIRDCELLRLTKAKFDRLLKQEPELMAGLNRLLVHRLRQISRGGGQRLEPKTIAFLPINDGIDAREIAEALAQRLAGDGYRIALLGPSHARHSSRWFTDMEREHDHLFLCGSLRDEEWVRLCARQGDRIMVLAEAASNDAAHLHADLFRQRAEHQLLDLVVLHDTPPDRPVGSAPWFARVPFNRLFHLRRDDARDWARLARVIAGRAVGLVLSGGGARAFAQLGVLKAAEEVGLAFDFVGGASMGAMLAAGVAMDWSAAELSARVYEAFVRSNPLNDYTLPIIGLVKGRKVERLLNSNFGQTAIEDLWLPYFCVSSNLTSGQLEVHRSGSLVRALRASVALPGILPPSVWGDSLLVDGAVMNNLPVDIMRGLHRGAIVAVDVTRDRSVTPQLLETPTGWAWLKRFLNPPLITLLMRAGTVTSEAHRLQLARDADLLIEPELGDIDIRDWQAFDAAVEIGYRHAKQALTAFLPRLRRARVVADLEPEASAR